jgi:hypothetical protein
MESYKFGGSGTLYFMFEKDRLTGAPSDYLKIGIVNKEKTVSAREKQHQTGNPRQISTRHEIESSGVQMLETSLHNHFATLRVKGEWFRVSEEQIVNMIELAEDRATELSALESDLDFALGANELERESHSEATSLDSELMDLESVMRVIDYASSEIKVHRANKSAISKRMTELRPQVDFPEDMFKAQERAANESLNIAKIRKQFPELVSEFEVIKNTWTYTLPFLSFDSGRKTDALAIDVEDFGADLLALHDAYLKTWSSISDHQWDFQIAESQLLALCGSAQTLKEGGQTLVHWEEKSRSLFSKSAFQEKYPEQASHCMVQTPSGVSFSVSEWRSY